MASRTQELLGQYLDHLRGEADGSPDLQGRQDARKILDLAANSPSKTIKRSDLKKAIQLYAGKQSTPSEQAAVGSKMLDFLSRKQIKLVA